MTVHVLPTILYLAFASYFFAFLICALDYEERKIAEWTLRNLRTPMPGRDVVP
ncbi:hypothetical protein NW765_004239 [Fusarium oxysporum]|nr:hypothetical protein NW765_004239 [Fusarium oxysporum]